jgi:hypothetical protein
MLGSTEVTLDAKRSICRQLRIIADAPEVPALAALLKKPQAASHKPSMLVLGMPLGA